MFVTSNRKILTVKGSEFTINVSYKVSKTWEKYTQNTSNKKEACGVLIGSYIPSSKTFNIENCTKPFYKDVRGLFFFKLQDIQHQKLVNKEHNKSNGTSFYLGTWHTHPAKYPNPSNVDNNDWERCMKRNPHIPGFLFCIIGTESNYYYPVIS